MLKPIPLRPDHDAALLRRIARGAADAVQVRRLLALAAIYDGGSRTQAAAVGGVTLQVVRDWVLRFNAHGPEGLIDWGSTSVKVFAGLPTSKVGAGFTCIFDFGFAETELQGMIMKGLLVLAQFHRFKDNSKRADFFVREYFALEHD